MSSKTIGSHRGKTMNPVLKIVDDCSKQGGQVYTRKCHEREK